MPIIINMPTDDELLKLCNDYVSYHGTGAVEESVFATYICGHLHTFTKRAEAIAKQCVKLGLIKRVRNALFVLPKPDFSDSIS